MTSTSFRAGALACALLSTTALSAFVATPAHAQLQAAAPVRQSVDENGVDLFRGTITVRGPSLSIGQADQGLDFYHLNRGAGWGDSLIATLSGSGPVLVHLGGVSYRFNVSSGVYTDTEGKGASLTLSNGTFTFTRSDGTVVRFDQNKSSRAVDMVLPNGAKLVYNYEAITYCSSWKMSSTNDICLSQKTEHRLGSLRSSYGYTLGLTYQPIDWVYDPDNPSIQPDLDTWRTQTGVTVSNSAVSGSASAAQTFSNSGVSPTFYHSITDAMNRQYVYRANAAGQVLGIKLPGDSAESVTIAYTNGRVSSVAKSSRSTSYSSSDLNGERTVVVTDPMGHATTYKFNIASERMTSVKDANNQTTTAQYDASGRATRITQPEQNYTQFTYDGRGNITERREVAKTGTGPGDIVTTAGYSATCANAKTCNQPSWTKDAKGNQTDYTYDATHGGVLTVTSPAAATGGIRPQTRYSYTSLQAYINGVASGQPVWRLTSTSACQTSTTCAGTADEVKTSINYGPQTAGTNNNLLPVSTSQGAGDNSLIATTAYAYDTFGNLETVDGPLSGTADTTRYRYNANRELIGTIAGDPDGTGALKHRAQRTTIDAKGLVSKVESGTVNSQSDADWAAFAQAEAVEMGYDGERRVITRKLTAGGKAYALTQTSYDSDGRVDCVAQRMNIAAFGSLPASACTLGTAGTDGPDRITKTLYDNEGQVTGTQVAVGTADQANETTLAYTANGKLQTLKDGENNLTTYEYDGFDRLWRTRYPVPTKGASTSSTSDDELLTYDANSNVTSRQLRDDQIIGFSFDNLNRPTLKNLPGTEPDVSYGYDLLGRLKSANQTGHNLSFTYDALGRNLTQVGPLGTVSSQWDAAGRRTRLTYPGTGLYIDYDYLVTGEMTKLRENGASSGVGVLATFAYDDLGRRTSLTRGNGTVTSYGYDSVSRLASLTEDMAGTTSDQSVTFSYNPASQISSLTKTNDLFAWTGHGAGTTSNVANGLNQLTSVGGGATAHDLRGNLTTDPTGGRTYSYSSENMFIGASGGVTLSYDPVTRLAQVVGSTTTKFQYDNLRMIAEYNSTNALQRRFVHGPRDDEPLVQFEGSGLADRRWLHADERGSIIAVSDTSGNVVTVNRYDEYGKPQSTNTGRFQYTGQAWLPEIGLSYYKARMYSPQLGRFLQTDPIGVAGGSNLYSYVGNNPVNAVDPSGRTTTIIVTGTRTPDLPPPPRGLSSVGAVSLVSVGGPTPAASELENECPAEGPSSENCNVTVTGVRVRPPSTPAATPAPRGLPPAVTYHPVARRDHCTGVPDNVGGIDISGPCYFHDECYGSSTERATCDRNLFNDIYNECRRQGGDRATCFLLGETYYIGVRIGGILFYEPPSATVRSER